jgi:diguanylate cyclase (GGDEF)-like protein
VIIHLFTGLVLFIIVVAMFIAYASMGTTLAALMDCVHWTLSYSLSAFLAYRSIVHSNPIDKRFKQWVSVGLMGLSIGQIISNVQLLMNWKAFPSIADVFFLMLGSCTIVGLWCLMKNRLSSEQFRAIPFDIITITLSVLTFTIVLYSPLGLGKQPIEIFVMVVYAVVLLTASFIFILFLLRSAPRLGRGWVLLLSGLCLQALASIEWNQLAFEKTLTSGHLINMTFSLSALFIGFGIQYWHFEPTKNPRYQHYCDTALRLIPLVAATFIAVALLLIINQGNISPQLHLLVVIVTILVLIIIVIRQSLLLLDSELLRKAEKQLQRLAFYDALTDLPNRRLLSERLKQTNVVLHERGFYGAILFIDIDHFKKINDTKGHDYGDLLLIAVANRLSENIAVDDTAARLGGDEFVVILSFLSEDRDQAALQAEKIAARLTTVVNQPYALQNSECICSVSVGIALFSGEDQSLDVLLKRSDSAMYQAKKAGRNRLHFYNDAVVAELDAKFALDSWMRASMNKYYELHYQAQVQMQVGSNQRVFGVEALLRLNHPERGLMLPAEFMPLAEETGLIVSIGDWVIQSACTQLKRWSREPSLNKLSISVNISVRQFYQSHFASSVKYVIDEVNINPQQLLFELTEALVLVDAEHSLTVMNELVAMGIRLSIDDFGTGQCSLNTLSTMPIHQLKIDQSLITNMMSKKSDALIVKATIAMADKFGFEVIAEAVETQAQVDFLLENGCNSFQGNFFGKPSLPTTLQT